jgi:hypothetical protein
VPQQLDHLFKANVMLDGACRERPSFFLFLFLSLMFCILFDDLRCSMKAVLSTMSVS